MPSTDEGAPPLSLRCLEGQGGDFDFGIFDFEVCFRILTSVFDFGVPSTLRNSKAPPCRTECDKDGVPVLGVNYAPWHFLYFFPDPQGQGSFRPTFSCPRTTCCTCCASPAPAMRACSSSRRLRLMKASSSSSAEVETRRGGRRPLPSPPRCAGTPGPGSCPAGPVGG